MMREIRESDWKILRELHPIALDRFCQHILSEVEAIMRRPTKDAHKKYLDIYGLTRKRDKEIAQAFNDSRRSNAFFQLASLKGLDLLTEEEFSRFSEETQSLVSVILG